MLTFRRGVKNTCVKCSNLGWLDSLLLFEVASDVGVGLGVDGKGKVRLVGPCVLFFCMSERFKCGWVWSGLVG